jgi:hypothetical protein
MATTLKRLERAFGALVTELEKAMSATPSHATKVMKRQKAVMKRHRVKYQGGLSTGIIKILEKKDEPVRMDYIIKRLPSQGYKVRNPELAMTSVSQTISRLVNKHLIERAGRGLYTHASTS